jgi:hypothetical protein
MTQLYIEEAQNKANALAANWRGLAKLYDNTTDHTLAAHAATLERCAGDLENKFGIEEATPREWRDDEQ